MHTEGRQDEYLIRLKLVKLIIHAHILTTMKMDIQFIIIMAVILCDLDGFIEAVTGFISLTALLHRLKWCLNIIGFQWITSAGSVCSIYIY